MKMTEEDVKEEKIVFVMALVFNNTILNLKISFCFFFAKKSPG